MLTLDALARMAERMPSEPAGSGGRPPYRRPDALRRRSVTLPSTRQEARRALRLLAVAVATPALLVAAAGVVVTYLSALMGATRPGLAELTAAAAWYAGWTVVCLAPFAAVGLGRELLRYRGIRRALGPTARLDARGWLTSDDGRRGARLAAGHERLGAPVTEADRG